ncbi:ABC transporter ATP-binding protein [Acuticoccus sp.]|uniref:ABC transporter ATP-binding protein n=1 Tax=Acuticoccus sp. TaxID=1904378 RepID=UPI003B51EC46
MPEILLSLRDVKVHFAPQAGLFGGRGGTVRAVDGVSFDVHRGETLGVVGESGCGKSTTGLAIVRMVPITEGTVVFEGLDITQHDRSAMRPVRRRLQMMFQDPYGSLDPRMRVDEIVAEPLVAHGVGRGEERRRRVAELLDMVGLNKGMAERYPHEFSGGQRQRIGIARALALSPDLIVCDEPVSALDVSIQAQIINLLEDLQRELGLTYVFIAHDLAVVRHISDRILVMYLGRVVEVATRDELYADPRHPYTKALMSAVPVPDPDAEDAREVTLVEGEVPSPINPPSGCHFHPRCPFAMPMCREEVPALRPREGRINACHLYA